MLSRGACVLAGHPEELGLSAMLLEAIEILSREEIRSGFPLRTATYSPVSEVTGIGPVGF